MSFSVMSLASTWMETQTSFGLGGMLAPTAEVGAL